jgi:hypothetical protein
MAADQGVGLPPALVDPLGVLIEIALVQLSERSSATLGLLLGGRITALGDGPMVLASPRVSQRERPWRL